MRLTIGRKLGVVNGLMVIMLLVAGAVGFWGVKSLSEKLEFVSGPAWDAATV